MRGLTLGRRWRSNALCFGIAILWIASSMGCVAVRPWDREMLGRPDMAWDPDPLETAQRGHVYFAKEATPTHGSGAGGGGCGCN
jgi:hypothetical protein